MGQTYSLSSTTDTVNDTVKDETMIENKIDSENLIESDDSLINDSLINNESTIEKESENDEYIKEIVTKFVDEVIDNAINIHRIKEQTDIFNREDFVEHRENIKNLITDDNESLISSVSSDSNSNSDRELYSDYDYDSESDSISVDAMEMEINNIEDIGVQVKMELLNSNKKIILLRGENERLKEEYDDLFFNFTRLKVKYDSLLCKRKRD